MLVALYQMGIACQVFSVSPRINSGVLENGIYKNMKLIILTLIVFAIDLYFCRDITDSWKEAFIFLIAITLMGAIIVALIIPFNEIVAKSGILDWYYHEIRGLTIE